MDRTGTIVKTSILGIVANVFLSGFKAFVGFASNSVAITMDAINNLSDAMSSLITLLGAKLSAKEPDKKHPFGYGRIEYLSAMIIGIIILYAGLASLKSSIEKIIHPETPDYSTAALIIVTAAIIVKVVLGLYTKNIGVKISSDSLIASGKDALNDSIISMSTLLAAIIFVTTGLSIEAYVGILISFIIIKTGYETLRDTISEILGERISSDLAKRVKKCINELDEVYGVYDLAVHNYGSEKLVASAHIEVREDMNAVEIDKLERTIVKKVFQELSVVMTGISVYSRSMGDPKISEAYNNVKKFALAVDYVLSMHGFYIDEASKEIKFDIVVDFDAPDKGKVHREVSEGVKKMYPSYSVEVNIDYDYSD